MTLPNPKNNDEINIIYENLYKFFKDKHKEGNVQIINLEELFKDLINFYSTKSLEDMCNLNNIVELLKNQKIESQYSEILHNEIHIKIMSMIKNLKASEIISLINLRDVYYFDPKYKNNENRDPSIFRYIPITDNDTDY